MALPVVLVPALTSCTILPTPPHPPPPGPPVDGYTVTTVTTIDDPSQVYDWSHDPDLQTVVATCNRARNCAAFVERTEPDGTVTSFLIRGPAVTDEDYPTAGDGYTSADTDYTAAVANFFKVGNPACLYVMA